MYKQGKLKITLPKDKYLFFILIIISIINFLPVVYVIPRILISLVEVALSGALFLFVLLKSRRAFVVNISVIAVVFLINLLAYFHCYANVDSIGSYVIRSTMCWIYMMVGVYVSQYASKRTVRMVFHFILFLLVITSITSILSVIDYPTAMRELGNGSMNIRGLESLLYRRNTATWSMVFAMVFVLPYLISALKKTHKFIYMVVCVILCLCILRSQITMALLMTIAVILLSVLKPGTNVRIFLIIGFVLLLVWIFDEQVTNLLYWLYTDVFGGTTDTVLGKRFYQLYISFQGRELVGTYGGRFDLYMTSIKSFLAHPFFGVDAVGYTTIVASGSAVGLHSQIFDTLAATGIFCSIFLACIFAYYVKREKSSIIEKENRNLFSNVVLLLVALMLMNPTYYSACIFFIVWLGSAYLNSLDEKKSEAHLYSNQSQKYPFDDRLCRPVAYKK